MASIHFLGAAQTVTGAKFVVDSGFDRVMVDCGLFQGLKEYRLRNWDQLAYGPADIDAIVLTHAHIDHSGYIPKLVKDGYQGPVFATGATTDLCKILLADSGELQEEQAEHANEHGYSKHSPALPLYTGADGHFCIRRFSRYPLRTRRRLLRDFWLEFQYAGHILGATIAELWVTDGSEQVKIVFSGDLGRYGDPLFEDPSDVESADYIVVESTYGGRSHDQASASAQLAEAVNRVATSGGVLVIPAFAVGRTQRLLYELRALEQAGAIPELPVYVDSPLAIDATDIFFDYPHLHRLSLKEKEANPRTNPLRCKFLEVVRSPKDSAALDDLRRPAIILSASGMATGGRVLNHLVRYLPDPNAVVLFVGFQAEGTRGRSLVDGATEVKMLGKMVDVKATIMNIDGYSAHADEGEIMRWLKGFKTAPKKVFVVHGEPVSSAALAARIERELGWTTYQPQYDEKVTL